MSSTEVQESGSAPVEETGDGKGPVITNCFVLRAVLKGHNLQVTSLKVSRDGRRLVSGSRDKTALVWDVLGNHDMWAVENSRLIGHNHFVSAVALTDDATHVLTSSWDKTIRMWDIKKRETIRKMSGHTKDVLDVTLSPGNRKIISCGRDGCFKIWNTHGQQMHNNHETAWVTCVECAAEDEEDRKLTLAVGFWDGKLKICNVEKKVEARYTLDGHQGRVNSLSFSPDSQFIVSGGSDKKVIFWIAASGEKMCEFTASSPVNCVACCPTNVWVAAATYDGVIVWDVSDRRQIDLVTPEYPSPTKDQRNPGRHPECTSLAWQEDGRVLYVGYNNGEILVWEVRSE